MLSKEWGFEFKARVSEIRVKRIRVNQGVGVFTFSFFSTYPYENSTGNAQVTYF